MHPGDTRVACDRDDPLDLALNGAQRPASVPRATSREAECVGVGRHCNLVNDDENGGHRAIGIAVDQDCGPLSRRVMRTDQG